MVTAENSSSIMAADRTSMPQGFRLMIAGSLNFKLVRATGQPFEISNLPQREPGLTSERSARGEKLGTHSLEEMRGK
jgi:hypothetical protein